MKDTLEQALEKAGCLDDALVIYIDYRANEIKKKRLGKFNSIWGLIGGFDADSKIDVAKKVRKGENISQSELITLMQGRLGGIINTYDKPKNVRDALEISEKADLKEEASFVMAH